MPTTLESDGRKLETKPIAFDEVRAKGWVVVGDGVYDVTKFVPRHRGGRAIDHLRGTDATLPLVNAHGVRGEIPTIPAGLRVGTLDASTLEPTDREMRELLAAYKARGLFEYSTGRLAFDAFRMLGLFALAGVSALVSQGLAFVVLTLGLLNVMWWVHDVCHDSVFADRTRAKFWAETASVLFVGTPVLTYQYVVHRLHHGFTNVIGADHALETGPIVWDERMRARSRGWFVAIQAWAWFLLVLPLTFPLFLAAAVVMAVKTRDWRTLAIVAVRWAVVLALFSSRLWLLFGPVFCAAYLLAFFSGLNHFHKPISSSMEKSFARSVTTVTQNMSHTGYAWTWITGGLGFHIEHHLFATMPRHNYRVIAPEIQAFCARHELEYSTCTLLEAVRALWGKLAQPFGNAAEEPHWASSAELLGVA